MNIDSIMAKLSTKEGRADPFPLYAAMHELGQVAALGDSSPHAAIVHGYAAVDKVLRDPGFLVTGHEIVARKKPDWRDSPMYNTLLNSTMFANPPDHPRMRRLFHAVLTPRRVSALEPAMTGMIDRLLDRIADLGSGGSEVEFMSEFAYKFPTTVMAALLGIPEEDLDWFRPRVDTVNKALDLGNEEAKAAADVAAAELAGYYTDQIALRRARPGDDLLSALLAAMEAGEQPISDTELIGNMVVTFNAGFVTTLNMLGNGMAQLLRNPDHAHAVSTDPDCVPGYVEEILRYEPAVHLVVRWASVDSELDGVHIPAGRSMLVMLGAANRDPARFPDPGVFDPTRPTGQAISFGAGAHYCLGAVLARTEGRLALPRLLQRFPKLRLGAEPVMNAQLLLRGYAKLPVHVS